MTRVPSSISKLKKLARSRPGIGDVLSHAIYAPTAEDRAIAIIETTNLEDALEDAIKSKMIDLNAEDYRALFAGDAPLSNFGTKIKLGFALGIYGKQTRNDLETIRLIRNAFAHCRTPLFFFTEAVKDTCNLLTVTTRTPNLKEFPGVDIPLDTPRKIFLGSTRLISGALNRLHWPEAYGRPSESAPLD